MPGSLVKIAETTVSSSTASVSLTGIDSTYDVYMCRFNNVTGSVDTEHLFLRVLVSGSPDTSANYDRARIQFKADTSFTDSSNQNETKTYIGQQIGTASNSQCNGLMYLFNFNNASEYSFGTLEEAAWRQAGNLHGNQGGWVHTVAQACNGVQFFMEDGNLLSGTFSLYGLKK
tara:strand:+ start:97 stop:615 length:519 start_codon:yes stop_codon:yes gene_type:complete